MEPMSHATYIGLSLLIYFLVGMKIYILDRVWGVKVRTWFYNKSHKEPLAESDCFGFIVNRRSSVRFGWAAFFASTTSLWLVLSMGTNPAIEVITFLFDSTAVFLGILFGPLAFRMWSGRKKTFDRIDAAGEAIKSGKVKDEFDDLSENLSEKGRGFFFAIRNWFDNKFEPITGERPFGTPASWQMKSEEAPRSENLEPETINTTDEPEESEEDFQGMIDSVGRS
jgi:hypothetical protein